MAKLGINTGSSPDAGDGDSLLIGALKINSNFNEIYSTIGDGSNITNSIGYATTAGIATYASTSRIVVRDSGSVIGTAGTIDFGNNLTVSAVSAGVVTVTASGGGTSTQWASTAAGIHTLSNVGVGTTNPTSALTVAGSGTSTSQLYVTGVSTFNDNVRVSGIVTANSVLVSNDGGNNGSVLIEDLGVHSQISFRASNGTTQTQIQGIEANLLITPGSGGYVSLSGPTNNIFYSNGDVILNSSQGTTHAVNGLRVTGLTSTTSFNVGTGGTIINATATGLVGIGTTNPTSALTVVGSGASLSQLYVTGISTFQAFNSYVEMGNPSYYAGLRLISGATEARILQSGAGDLYLTSQSSRNISLNTYAMFGDSSNIGNVQLNHGNVGDTKVGSAITFTSSTGSIYAGGNVRVGVNTSSGVILTSPNGTQYRLIVDDSGTLSTVAV